MHLYRDDAHVIHNCLLDSARTSALTACLMSGATIKSRLYHQSSEFGGLRTRKGRFRGLHDYEIWMPIGSSTDREGELDEAESR